MRRFLSSRQFQTMGLIWIGGAASQPLPLRYPDLQPLKPESSSLVTRVGLVFSDFLFF